MIATVAEVVVEAVAVKEEETAVALAAETVFAQEASDATIASRKGTLAVNALTHRVQKVATTAAARVTLAVTVLSHERSARRIASIAMSPATLPPSAPLEAITTTISKE